jgi:hypothetical protein
MADPNWLFSACAQTAGAIVAIVGGFLATRLVTLSSERNSLRQRIDIVLRRLTDAERRKATAKQRLREWEERDFSSAVVGDVVDQNGVADVARLATTHETWEIPIERIRQLVEGIEASCRSAFEQLRNVEGLLDMEFEDVVRIMCEPTGLDREILGRVYHAVRREQAKDIGAVVARAATTNTGSPSAVVSLMEEIQLKTGERTLAQQQLETASVDETNAITERDALQARLEALRNPAGLRYAWCILAYMTAVGVALPLALLPSSQDALDLKWIILGPFFLGLVLLLHYFARVFRWQKD